MDLEIVAEKLSIILPAKDEAPALRVLLPELKRLMPDAEIIVVDDGSVDDTAMVCQDLQIKIISHPYSMGNGAAIKTGARAAQNPLLLLMDADGQHQPEDIGRLLEKFEQNYDMVVGARGRGSQANLHRGFANGFYNRLASWMVGHRVADLTSGFRLVKTNKFRQFLYLLPNGFSYPTTITMSFFRAGFGVAYVPINTQKRIGRSHVNIIRDGVRFLLIIFKIGSLYSPLKLFVPVALFHALLGIGYYVYTFSTNHRLSSMSVFLLSAAITIFMIGLVSEQITALMYKDQVGRE